MKVPYTWLNELVEINKPIHEISEALSIAGFEVESVEDFATRAYGVVVGFIEEFEKHPQADRLNICRVNIGTKDIYQIVCGAPNVRKGVHVLVAPPGAFLSAKGLKIKSTKLRGIKSDGMICSLSELGIYDETNGIAILEDINVDIPDIGSSILELFGLDESVLDIAITANRPDGMSMVGIAREVSALLESKLTLPEPIIKNDIKIFEPDFLDKESIGKNGIYSLTIINNVNGILQAPKVIKNRLANSGINSINAIVDYTNYIMLEQGQPLHSFDLDSLENITGKKVDQTSFGVRKSTDSEEINALDGNKYKLNKKITVITCHNIPIAVAGVIGGKESAVNKSTKNIILECALFSSTSVRISSRSIGIRTESSSRYEKGISEQNTLSSINRYLDLLKVSFKSNFSDTFIDKDLPKKNTSIKLRRIKIDNILGCKVNKDNTNKDSNINNILIKSNTYLADKEIDSKLILLGCSFNKNENDWNVNVPAHRSIDLVREIDLIEEIARLVGYDKFEANLPDPLKPGGLNKQQQIERNLRKYLCSAGLQEVTTFSLVPSKKNDPSRIPISNPLLAETSHLRTNLWEEHLNICERNIKSGQKGCWLYEIGSLYYKEESKIIEKSVIAGAMTGERRFERWTTNGKDKPIEYFEARGLIHKALIPLKITINDYPLTNNQLLHPGRSASLNLEGNIIGWFGQVHPNKIDKYNIEKQIYLFELDLEAIIKAATRRGKDCIIYKEFATVPYMERDIAVIVDKNCSSSKITALIYKFGRPLLENVELIDRYEGGNLPDGKISQAFRMRYRDKTKTLSDNEINPIHSKIRDKLVSTLGAELRS